MFYKKRRERFALAFLWNCRELSKMPLAINATTVTILRSRAESFSSRAQTSPNSTSSFSSANFGANSPRASLPAVTFSIKTSPFVLFYDYRLLYSASLTDSHHSVLQSVPGTSTAICENQLSRFAPCQCLTFAGIVITVPAVRLTAAFPSS